MPHPNINDVRDSVVTIVNGQTNMNMVLALALIYVGDSIREAATDTGLVAKAMEQAAVNIGGIQMGLNDLGREIANMPEPKVYATIRNDD